MVPIDTGPSDATQGYENSRNCIRFGDLFPLCFDSCIVGTISADDPVRQYITLQHTLADRLTPLQWIPNPHHANLPIRAMASGEPFPCTYLLTQPSAQLASPPSPIYKTTTSRGRSVIGSPVCSSSTPAYRILRYVRYLSSCVVLRPAACNSDGARYCDGKRVLQMQMRSTAWDALPLSLVLSRGGLRFVNSELSSHCTLMRPKILLRCSRSYVGGRGSRVAVRHPSTSNLQLAILSGHPM
jgi:hypothetical protein